MFLRVVVSPVVSLFVVLKTHRCTGSEQWVSASAGSPEPEDEALFGFGGNWGLTCHCDPAVTRLCVSLGPQVVQDLPREGPSVIMKASALSCEVGRAVGDCSSNESVCCVLDGPEALLAVSLSIQYPTKQIHRCPPPCMFFRLLPISCFLSHSLSRKQLKGRKRDLLRV